MTDKYDEQAKELLPCEFVVPHDKRECLQGDKVMCATCACRPAIAAALREMGDKIERYKTQHQQYVKLEAEQDEEIESLRVEIKRLRTMSTVEMMCENENVKFHVIEWENRCLKAEAVIREKDAEIERLKKQLESTSQRSAWSAP